MLHFLETGIEPGFEFFPFRSVCVFSPPGKTVEFVEIELLENDLKRHGADNFRAKCDPDRQRNRMRHNGGVLHGWPVRAGRGSAARFQIGFFTDLLKQSWFALRVNQLAHSFESFESVFTIEHSRLIRRAVFGEKNAAAKPAVDGCAPHPVSYTHLR